MTHVVKTLVRFVTTTVAVIAMMLGGLAQAQAKKDDPKDSYNLPDRIIMHDKVLGKAPKAQVVIDLGDDWEEFLEMLAEERGSSTGFLKMLMKSDAPAIVYASSEEMCVWNRRITHMIFKVKYSFINKQKELVVARFDMADIFEPRTIKALETSGYPRCSFEKSENGRYDVVNVYYKVIR